MIIINFVSGGFLGDFIHQLNVVRCICAHEGAVANLYISDGYGGDTWRYGAKKAYEDMYDVIKEQWYINEFNYLEGEMQGKFINLNDWRKMVATTHAETGKYDKCWTELLSQYYGSKIPKQYDWMIGSVYDLYTKGKVVIHRSKHRHNGSFDWVKSMRGLKCVFVSCDPQEWQLFQYKEGVEFYQVKDVTEMVNAIWSADAFIGNQSAPLAIASALDKYRLCELDADPAPFYMGEEKYSNNIKWFLNDQINNL